MQSTEDANSRQELEGWLWMQAGKRVCREGRGRKVGGSWKRKQAEADCDMCVQWCLKFRAASPVTGTCLSFGG